MKKKYFILWFFVDHLLHPLTDLKLFVENESDQTLMVVEEFEQSHAIAFIDWRLTAPLDIIKVGQVVKPRVTQRESFEQTVSPLWSARSMTGPRSLRLWSTEELSEPLLIFRKKMEKLREPMLIFRKHLRSFHYR